jgi:hypothetical protein
MYKTCTCKLPYVTGHRIWDQQSVHRSVRFDGPEARQTSKPQNERPLFDIELRYSYWKLLNHAKIQVS